MYQVLRGIRQMGGVGAICRETEGRADEGESKEAEKERRRAEKLWSRTNPLEHQQQVTFRGVLWG